MPEHTPGPYQIGLPGGPAGPFWSLVNAHGNVVAMQITSAENAALLAAAPDLLEACIALLRFNEELCQDVGVSTHYPSADRARAAIGKATGERQP